MSWVWYRRLAVALLLLPGYGVAADAVVVDFEQAALIFPDERPNRVEQWVEKGVIFKLAHAPRQSKGKGLVMFFSHLTSGHKGILSAMALEPIPVQATFPKPVSSVSVALWGSTGTPAVLEAFDAEGKVVDRVSLKSVPGRKAPGDPIPIFTMTVSAPRIAYVEFSGPRQGEYLAADEVRFLPIEDADAK
ncbi:MAG: hypothetical protein ABI824_16290 [Acidobacteriota bacterium]